MVAARRLRPRHAALPSASGVVTPENATWRVVAVFLPRPEPLTPGPARKRRGELGCGSER
jgi:hypothetical protein